MTSHRSALVTGSASGIGRGVVLALAREGYRVAVHYRHSAAEAEATRAEAESFGVQAIGLQADMTDRGAAASFVGGSARATRRACRPRQQRRQLRLQAAPRAVARGVGRHLRYQPRRDVRNLSGCSPAHAQSGGGRTSTSATPARRTSSRARTSPRTPSRRPVSSSHEGDRARRGGERDHGQRRRRA
jgi:hypothetical protein